MKGEKKLFFFLQMHNYLCIKPQEIYKKKPSRKFSLDII